MNIFVAVGTQKFPFNRLLKLAEELSKEGQEVFVQTGNSDYKSSAYSSAAFLNPLEYEKKIAECDVLVTHSGVGTIISGIKSGKKVIVVPRLSKNGEHVDDHQIQIADAFSKLNFILQYKEGDKISDLVEQAKNKEFAQYESGR